MIAKTPRPTKIGIQKCFLRHQIGEPVTGAGAREAAPETDTTGTRGALSISFFGNLSYGGGGSFTT